VGFVRHRDQLERWMGYRTASAISALRMMVRLRSFTVELRLEGQVRTYRTALVFLGVGERETRFPNLGGRVPHGRRGLHVIAVQGKAVARLTALGIAAAARGIKQVSREADVDSFLVDECSIVLRKRRGYLAVDGEVLRMETPFRYRLARNALHVVAPPEHHDAG
jgi:diacylglycerol kinase family enzyme